MARPRTALLSRESIAEAAIELVEAGGDLQIVPLAKKLGVSVSSLYHHVDGRTGILHAMREVLTARYIREIEPGETWEETVRFTVRMPWRMYADHPRVLQYLITVVINEPEVMGMYTTLADALEEAGLPDDEMLLTIETLDAFSFGVALDALAPTSIFEPGEGETRFSGLLAKHPKGAARNEQLFERGLDLIIDGIRARVAAAAA